MTGCFRWAPSLSPAWSARCARSMVEGGGAGALSGSNGRPLVLFTARGFLRGVRRALPVGVSTVVFGLVFGVLSRKAGLSIGEVGLMSALVFTGSGQVVAIGMWSTPIPTLPIIGTTLLVGLRHVLMGLTLQPWFSQIPLPRAYASYFLLTDESWALTQVEFQYGIADGAVLVGAGLLFLVLWVGSTTVGRMAAASIRDPSAWGLDFALVGVFIALLASLARGRSMLLPWTMAGVVSVAADRWLPGTWYVLLGAIAGSTPALLRKRH
jgi:4-azaleucine resistance transporter AzlC